MKKHLLAIIILLAYSAILIKIMVFKDLPIITIGSLRFNFGGSHEGPANLIPFKTILPYLLGYQGLIIAGVNLIGNIVLLVPIGFLVRFLYRNMTWKKSLAFAVAAGLIIEGMQEILRVGIFDIDDVILNGLGVMVGYWAFMILAKTPGSIRFKTLIIPTMFIIASASLAAFYDVSFYQNDQELVRSRPVAGNSPAGHSDTTKGSILQGADPCKGTGGTGQIISLGNNIVTIKLHNGTNKIIHLTNQTTIRSYAGPLSQSDLRTGNRVTVVADSNDDGSMTAMAVLVCNAASSEPVK